MRRFQQELPGLTRITNLFKKETILHYHKKSFTSTATTRMASPAAGAGELLASGGQGQEQGPPPGHRPDYSTWSTPSLIARITELERQLHSQTVQYATTTASLPPKPTTETPSLPSSTLPPPPVDIKVKATEQESPKEPLTKKLKAAANPPIDDIDFTQTRSPGRPVKEAREIDPSKYHTRFIALKFAYLGQRYNGYEHANGNVTPLPTIEEELWKALRRTRLIMPPVGSSVDSVMESGPRVMRPYSITWEGCQYSKAGRTDRGVSAFGQVIGIRVRSARPKLQTKIESEAQSEEKKLQGASLQNKDEAATELEDSSAEKSWDDVADELPYINTLNRVLPDDIRILAWCPHPPADFDARFSCRERRYKYFFTQPAFAPTPGPLGFAQGPRSTKYREGWLDIAAMREAAKYFEGVHDFRNFCKVDTSKQIDNFERIIYHADIELVDSKTNSLSYVGKPGFQALEEGCSNAESTESSELSCPNTAQVYAFTLHGSAFLWHQVRHMVGILFLIGQGLEPPSIVPELLNISKNPRKPTYEMASDAPLVLWDCIFPDEKSGSREDALEWIYAGNPRMTRSRSAKGDGKFGIGGVVDELWAVWRQRKMDEILAGSLLDLAVSQGDQSIIHRPQSANLTKPNRTQKVFFGGNDGRLGGKYVPVMQKRKMEPVEVQNARWLASKQRRMNKEPNPEEK